MVVVQVALNVKKRRSHSCAAAFGTRQIPTSLRFLPHPFVEE